MNAVTSRDRSQNSQFEAVDAFRGLAAAMVLVFHMDQCGFKVLPREWSVLGALGVNLFFTLSGFLIARAVLQPAAFDRRQYFRNRSLRILPNYYACCVLMLFLVEPRTIAHSTPAMLAFDLGTHSILMHGWFNSVSTSIIGPLWTLSHEWIFYLVMGAVAIPLRSGWGWAVPAGLLLMAVIAKFALANGVWTPSTGRYNPVCFWDQFALGIFGAQVSFLLKSRREAGGEMLVWLAALCGLILVAWSMHRQYVVAEELKTAHAAAGKVVGVKSFAVEFTDKFFRRKSNVIWFPCAFSAGVSLLLVAMTSGFRRLNQWIGRTPLPWMGKVSYSTYLYHMAVVLCLMRGLRNVPEGGLFAMPGVASVIAIVGVYAISAFCFHFFERPWLVRKTIPPVNA